LSKFAEINNNNKKSNVMKTKKASIADERFVSTMLSKAYENESPFSGEFLKFFSKKYQGAALAELAKLPILTRLNYLEKIAQKTDSQLSKVFQCQDKKGHSAYKLICAEYKKLLRDVYSRVTGRELNPTGSIDVGWLSDHYPVKLKGIALWDAARRNDSERVEQMFQGDSKPPYDFSDISRCTQPIMYALSNNNAGMTEILLEHQGDVGGFTLNFDGIRMVPLSFAVAQKSDEAVDAYFEPGKLPAYLAQAFKEMDGLASVEMKSVHGDALTKLLAYDKYVEAYFAHVDRLPKDQRRGLLNAAQNAETALGYLFKNRASKVHHADLKHSLSFHHSRSDDGLPGRPKMDIHEAISEHLHALGRLSGASVTSSAGMFPAPQRGSADSVSSIQIQPDFYATSLASSFPHRRVSSFYPATVSQRNNQPHGAVEVSSTVNHPRAIASVV
jgi:hypothetical protein